MTNKDLIKKATSLLERDDVDFCLLLAGNLSTTGYFLNCSQEDVSRMLANAALKNPNIGIALIEAVNKLNLYFFTEYGKVKN